MHKLKWETDIITSEKQAAKIMREAIEEKPILSGFDTETTGLHILADKPFIFIFGYKLNNKDEGRVYAIDMEKYPTLSNKVIRTWQEKVARYSKYYCGHNIKYDLHMMINHGLPYNYNNILDTTSMIRWAHDALAPAEGGPTLRLKAYADRFITPGSSKHEKELAVEKTEIAHNYNIALKKASGKDLLMWVAHFQDPLNEPRNTKEKAYQDWYGALPVRLKQNINGLIKGDDVPYFMLNRDKVLEYSLHDVILTIEVFCKLMPTIKAKGQEYVMNIEHKLLRPILNMERNGFEMDLEYLNKAKSDLRKAIKISREKLWSYTKTRFKAGQHSFIKEFLNTEYNLGIESTSNDYLEKEMKRIHDTCKEAYDFILELQNLRSLEKWYMTYIRRFEKDLNIYPNKCFCMLNQAGTISGRFTSDWQQMPKDGKGIRDKDGNIMFSPRRLVKGNLIGIDYSGQELRIQALYTILCEEPDLHMCRAYMPYQCYYKTPSGTVLEFDYTDPNMCNMDFISTKKWYQNEDNKEWTPTDIHGKTTELATGMKPTDPGFKEQRTLIGKKVNFSKQYGASRKVTERIFPDATPAEIDRIDGSFYKAFPGILNYANYCACRARDHEFTENLYGVKYYGVNGHKLRNVLIQGSGAYMMKLAIINIDKYLEDNKLNDKIKMILTVHDELLFQIFDRENSTLKHIFKIKEIMEKTDGWYIPIVAEIEATNKNWGEKKAIENMHDLVLTFL